MKRSCWWKVFFQTYFSRSHLKPNEDSFLRFMDTFVSINLRKESSWYAVYQTGLQHCSKQKLKLQSCYCVHFRTNTQSKVMNALFSSFVKIVFLLFFYKDTFGRARGVMLEGPHGYRRRKWTRPHVFKSWTRLNPFNIALIHLGKV